MREVLNDFNFIQHLPCISDIYSKDIERFKMCRSKSESGAGINRRCTHQNPYGKRMVNLQAQKQYHTKHGNEEKLQQVVKEMQDLQTKRSVLESKAPNIQPFVIPISPAAEKTLNVLTAAGLTPYIVGGTVRDALTQQPIKDVDIEVYNADHDEIVKALKSIGKVDEVGKQFGVIKVIVDGEDFDVSLPRIDNKVGIGHKDFTVEVNKDLTIQEATERRDFTVNALMYDHSLGYIIDAHTGIQDYKDRTLKHVSEAFDEDPLRVLRGVQMAARFDMELHPDTVERAKKLSGEFDSLAKERVQMEFQKLFTKSYYPNKGFKVLKDTEWDKNFPGLANVNNKALHEDLQSAGTLSKKLKLNEEERVMLFGSVIASRVDADQRRNFLSYITVGDKLKNETYNIVHQEEPENSAPHTIKAWVYNMEKGVTVENWVRSQQIINPSKNYDKVLTTARELNINNKPEKDIMDGQVLSAEVGRNPGRWMKEAMNTARSAQYNNEFNDSETALAWIKKNSDKLQAMQ